VTLRSFTLWALLALALFSGVTTAHESRPAYLEINELEKGRYSLLWRTPVLVGQRLPVVLRLPESFQTVGEPVTTRLSDSLLERRLVESGAESIAGQRIEFVGLQATITDVLVRVQYRDGQQTTTLVHPSQPWMQLPEAQGRLAVFATYIRHGVDHILLGFDHLLFVLALLLIVRNVRALVWTITAFTVAHSITLSLAVLGFVAVPGPPVEASIALSIVLLAYEIFRVQRGQDTSTARWPWVVAFTFGLLHGFGFAGALSELGLPPGDIPLALLAFNVGVELGQLAFIAVVLSVIAVARRFAILRRVGEFALPATAYAIGGLATFWFLERAGQILGIA